MVCVYVCFSAKSSTISSRFKAVWVVWFRGLICCLCFLFHWASASSCFSYWQAALSALTSAFSGSLNCGAGKSERREEEVLQKSRRRCRLAEPARKWGFSLKRPPVAAVITECDWEAEEQGTLMQCGAPDKTCTHKHILLTHKSSMFGDVCVFTYIQTWIVCKCSWWFCLYLVKCL